MPAAGSLPAHWRDVAAREALAMASLAFRRLLFGARFDADASKTKHARWVSVPPTAAFTTVQCATWSRSCDARHTWSRTAAAAGMDSVWLYISRRQICGKGGCATRWL